MTDWRVCFQDEANKIKKEASDLDKLIDKTEKEYNDLRDDLKGKEQDVRKLLEKGKSEQQVRGLLYAKLTLLALIRNSLVTQF